MLILNANSPHSLCTHLLSRLCRRLALHMFPNMALQSACFKQMA